MSLCERGFTEFICFQRMNDKSTNSGRVCIFENCIGRGRKTQNWTKASNLQKWFNALLRSMLKPPSVFPRTGGVVAGGNNASWAGRTFTTRFTDCFLPVTSTSSTFDASHVSVHSDHFMETHLLCMSVIANFQKIRFALTWKPAYW